MAADASIYSNALQPLRSAVDYANDYAKADALRNQNALQAFTLNQAAQKDAANMGVRNALQALGPGASLDQQIGAVRALGTPEALAQADTLDTSQQNRQKAAASAAKDNADAAATRQKAALDLHQQHLQALSTVNSPDDALQWVVSGVQSGALPAAGLQQAVTALQGAASDPTGQAFAKWKQQTAQAGMTVQQQMELNTAKPTEVRLGNTVKTIDMNPHSPTFGKEVTPTQAIGLSPDTEYTQQQENARSAANRANALTIAGMGPNGTLSPALEAEAQMIAAGRAAPPSGMAATRPAAATLMARVSQINPDYDATTYGAKVKAAKDFTSGTAGNQLRAFQVANDHLEQLQELAQALNNGNIPLINKIGNAYGVQTGQAPAAVFNAVRQLVGPEITSAIVLGGGSAHERDQAAATFDPSSSPTQFLATIGATKGLMRAKYNAMLDQRRAAGLPDSTLPQYGAHGAAPSNGGLTLPTADAIAAELARRGVK